MSLIQSVTAACPACGASAAPAMISSINADRRPDLRAAVLEDRLQVVTCEACAAEFRISPALTFVDFERAQWILAHPAGAVAQWRQLESDASVSFDNAFGAAAPEAAREIGVEMTPRITFGWAALREKVLAHEQGLDDLDLEIVKMAVMRSVPAPPFADELDLRLDGIDADGVMLSWVARDTGAVVTSVTVPRQVYDDVAAEKEAWAPLRAELSKGLFVDVQRLLVA